MLSKAAHQLLAQAQDLVAQDGQDYRLAVILAHAACDLETEGALNRLIEMREIEDLRDALLAVMGAPQLSLGKDRVRSIYTALSQDDPAQALWWSDWRNSVERRNAVAHKGADISRQDATASVDVATKYAEHLALVVGKRQMYGQ
jgi:hypothetical protein